MTRNFKFITASFALGTFALGASAAPVTVSSYTVDNHVAINNIVGKDSNVVTPIEQSLIDGLGKAGLYTPTSFFWDAGQEGTIYLENDANITGGQASPDLRFDLGSAKDFAAIYVHYGVRSASAIVAFEEVRVTVDGNLVGTFSGHDTSDSVENFGDIRVLAMDVGAQNGQFVDIEILGGVSGIPAAGGTTWHGLTEVEFDTDPVPEPGSLALLGLGGLAMLRRRRTN